MVKLQFLALAIAGLKFSAAVPLSVTTSSDNALADILAAFKGTDTITDLGVSDATPTIPNAITGAATTTDALIPGLSYLTSITSAPTISTVVTPDITSIASLISQIASSNTHAPSSSVSSSTTTTSVSSVTSGEQSSIFTLLISVVKVLAHTFGLSDSVVNSVESAIDELGGQGSSTVPSTATSTGV